ncbi:MAG: alanine racemase [Candidatus Sumerlaeia bacterium]|nr:alanine racemase [Candidatus Sumerlaeia bacterium]
MTPATSPPLLEQRASLRPTAAVIDLAALWENLDFIRRTVGPRTGILAVVKADAYGHGMVPVARACLRWGVQGFAVGTADEALELRGTAGFESIPVLVMGPTDPTDARALQEAQVSVAGGTTEVVQAHVRMARRFGFPARIHLKLDTGMGRYGFDAESPAWFELARQHREHIEGVFTHFACAESAEQEDGAFTNWQRERFEAAVRRIYRLDIRPVYHAANSGAVLRHAHAHYELVRPGILMYGAEPSTGKMVNAPVRQVLKLASRLAAVHQRRSGSSISYGRTLVLERDTPVGLVPIGYGDGYPRAMSSRAQVLVGGRRARVLGRVCMDQILVDLSDIPEARPGDEVVLYGAQGTERISLEEAAEIAGTIPYELACHLSRRVPRIYLEDYPEA